MKKLSKAWFCPIALFTLVGCSTDEMEPKETASENIVIESKQNNEAALNTNISKMASIEEVTPSNSHINESKVTDEKNLLSAYSNQQIEYARIWFQLGTNQEIDKLNITHIPASTPLNTDDETSATYPEDVIQLTGNRLVDGSVTYSGNGDGTINVYNVPLRWDGVYPAGEAFYINIIENTKKVYIEPQSDEKIIKLIQLQE